MPIDVVETPISTDQGIGEWIGASRKEVGSGHPGLDFGIVEFNLRAVINPDTGAVYFGNEEYETGGIDITAIVADTRHCRFQRILHMQVTPWDSDDTFTGHQPVISVPNGQFKIHRPSTGDVLLKIFVQSGVLDEPNKEMDNAVQLPDITFRVLVVGVRGNNPVSLEAPA